MVGFFQLRKLIPPGLSYFTITLTNFIGSATVFFPLSGMAMLCTSISEIGLNPFIISGANVLDSPICTVCLEVCKTKINRPN